MNQTVHHAENGDVERLVTGGSSFAAGPACGDPDGRAYWCVAVREFSPLPLVTQLRHRPTCEQCNIILDEALEGRDIRKEIQAARALGFVSRQAADSEKFK